MRQRRAERAVRTGDSSFRGWLHLNSCISSWKGSPREGAMSIVRRRTREERCGELWGKVG